MSADLISDDACRAAFNKAREQRFSIHRLDVVCESDIFRAGYAAGRNSAIPAPLPDGVNGLEVRATEDHRLSGGGSEFYDLVRLCDAQAAITAERDRRLDAPAQVGNTIFSTGIKERSVIDAAKRYAEHMAQPEQHAERIARGAAFLAELQSPAQVITLTNQRDKLAALLREVAPLFAAPPGYGYLHGTIDDVLAEVTQ